MPACISHFINFKRGDGSDSVQYMTIGHNKNDQFHEMLRPDSILICLLTSIGNPIVEIRRFYDRLISTMGFPILVRLHLYIDSGPWFQQQQAMLYTIQASYHINYIFQMPQLAQSYIDNLSTFHHTVNLNTKPLTLTPSFLKETSLNNTINIYHVRLLVTDKVPYGVYMMSVFHNALNTVYYIKSHRW